MRVQTTIIIALVPALATACKSGGPPAAATQQAPAVLGKAIIQFGGGAP